MQASARLCRLPLWEILAAQNLCVNKENIFSNISMDFTEDDIVQSSVPESDNENDIVQRSLPESDTENGPFVTVFQAIQTPIVSNINCEVSDCDD